MSNPRDYKLDTKQKLQIDTLKRSPRAHDVSLDETDLQSLEHIEVKFC